MATRLKKLRINRVDVVDKSANQHARLLLFKRAGLITKEDDDPQPRTVAQIVAQRAASEQWWELTRALECSIHEIMEHAAPEDQAALLTQTVNEFSVQAKDLIPQMTLAKSQPVYEALETVAKAGRVIATERLGRIKAALAALQQIVREAEPEEKDDDMAETDVEKRAKEAEAENAALKKQLEEATAKLAKGDPEQLMKRLEQAEKDVAVEKARREEREYIEKASRFATLPVKPEDDWRVFKAIDGLDESVRDRLTELLHAADGQLAIAGALGQVGKGGERRGGASAWDEASGLASGVIAKSAGMSFDTAIQQVWRERPDLYERHRKESRSSG